MRRRFSESLNNAVDGLVYAFRTEPHLKVHFAISMAVLVLCLVLDLEPAQLLAIFIAITLVLMAELFNTALETIVNMQTLSHHPLARVAKDVSAGAVLLASVNAVAVGCIVFWEPVKAMLWGAGARNLYQRIAENHTHGLVVLLALALIVVMIGKALGQRGQFTRGGMISGHAAIAFAASTAILVVTRNPVATVLAFVMALLVAQSRVEANIHRWVEVLTGALVGVAASLLVFTLFHGLRTQGP
ncbi:MAG: diacylglycerol kinase [Proteobacteria bacterium]|nr:diacylglycerol kinase [Pseudomonadota bacterium]